MLGLRSKIPSPNWLVTFEAAARCLSFTRAAEELNVTRVAVSQQVKALEGFLGAQLFERLHRSLSFATDDDVRVRVDLDIAPDDDDPHAILAVFAELSGEELFRGRVAPDFKLTAATVQRVMRGGDA